MQTEGIYTFLGYWQSILDCAGRGECNDIVCFVFKHVCIYTHSLLYCYAGMS